MSVVDLTMTIQIPTHMEDRVKTLEPWLPTILEILLTDVKRAKDPADTCIQFLIQGPSPDQVLAFHLPKKCQNRRRRLMVLNRERLLTEDEHLELDEMEALEQIMIRLMANLTGG